MEIIGLGVAYLVLAAFCYYAFYANAVDENESLWQFFISDQKGVLKLLALDFLKIHCPWSKNVSIRYRVQKARSLLQDNTHEKGWTVIDCDNPANHRQIAKDCFQTRTRFWLQGIFTLLTSPLRILLLAVIITIAMVVLPAVSAGQWTINLVRR